MQKNLPGSKEPNISATSAAVIHAIVKTSTEFHSTIYLPPPTVGCTKRQITPLSQFVYIASLSALKELRTTVFPLATTLLWFLDLFPPLSSTQSSSVDGRVRNGENFLMHSVEFDGFF